MSLLPKKIRFWLFDTLSLKTMRYVDVIPRHKATGLVAEIYHQIEHDFFINGSLTSRSQIPSLLAAIWVAGRETILVDNKLDRTTKEAMAATLSSINACPYCGDMLVSLVHAGDKPEAAMQILAQQEESISDPVLCDRLTWLKAVTTPGAETPSFIPFTEEELPEAIGSIMAMGDVNRFSHVVMAGSPVSEPFGISHIKQWALRRFGDELRTTHIEPLTPGEALPFLPHAELPNDMQWASQHPRIATALARWTATVEREAQSVVPAAVQKRVHEHLTQWQGEQMSLSRNWVEQEITGLSDSDKPLARLALLLAKASYQIDDKIIEDVLGADKNQERFIRILAWCSFTASRYVAKQIAHMTRQALQNQVKAA